LVNLNLITTLVIVEYQFLTTFIKTTTLTTKTTLPLITITTGTTTTTPQILT
jgi:hypothetical protein